MSMWNAWIECRVARGRRHQHLGAFWGVLAGWLPPAGGGAGAELRCGGDAPKTRIAAPARPPARPRPAAGSSPLVKMVSRVVCTMLSGLMFWLTFGWAATSAYSPRTPDRVSETDIQRLLHGVMEQLGIARPRVEYPAHQAMNLVGPQSIEGGAHEGLQHLGPFGNIPNIVAELTGDNIPKDFSEDQGYPDPPNPCPVGKTVDDGCLENAPDTAEFSREFQLHQHLYDPEHDYPGLGKWNKKLLYEKMKGGQRRKRRSVNPYLQGQRLDNVVAKKSVPHFSEEDKDPE